MRAVYHKRAHVSHTTIYTLSGTKWYTCRVVPTHKRSIISGSLVNTADLYAPKWSEMTLLHRVALIEVFFFVWCQNILPPWYLTHALLYCSSPTDLCVVLNDEEPWWYVMRMKSCWSSWDCLFTFPPQVNVAMDLFIICRTFSTADKSSYGYIYNLSNTFHCRKKRPWIYL